MDLNKKFLAIGDNAMPGNELQECINDARFYGSVLAKSLDINADYLLDKASTKQNILSWIQAAQKQAIDGKLTYCGIAISNHGTHQMVNGLLEGAICCYDMRPEGNNWWPGGLFTATEFQKLMNGFPIATRVEIWLDICYSFSLTKGLRTWNNKAIHNPDNPAGLMRVSDKSVVTKLNSNIVVWSACSEAQESADAPNLGNGAFTYYWKKAWQENPTASRVDLITSTRAKIAAGGFDQVPRLACWNVTGQMQVGV